MLNSQVQMDLSGISKSLDEICDTDYNDDTSKTFLPSNPDQRKHIDSISLIIRDKKDETTEMADSASNILEDMIGRKDFLNTYLNLYWAAVASFENHNKEEVIEICNIMFNLPDLPLFFVASVNLLVAAVDSVRADFCIAEAERVMADVRQILSDRPPDVDTQESVDTIEMLLKTVKEAREQQLDEELAQAWEDLQKALGL